MKQHESVLFTTPLQCMFTTPRGRSTCEAELVVSTKTPSFYCSIDMTLIQDPSRQMATSSKEDTSQSGSVASWKMELWFRSPITNAPLN